MSFIVEQAGGKRSYGHQIYSINIQLAKIHPKVTLYIGSKEEMEKLDDVFERFMSFSFVDSKIA
ncbi:hypothetical protein BRARA_G01075 [Brassica rapa]|uniref:Fructose-1-6-bisphosphatase class 1 C-terminal domain-containing protein n=2 Tax=Brassica campestris TaxID=3711 RepID=A0A397YLQ0_BRACM|nr:hypothetical protein IGI04_006861 [Brassica rapa subsp. trilocularis]RID53698.1 hypothetical protein BRARA_G01075 [Brassica rapa]